MKIGITYDLKDDDESPSVGSASVPDDWHEKVWFATHADIARYAKRNVSMRDGLILKDTLVTRPLDSHEELRRWKQAEQSEPALAAAP